MVQVERMIGMSRRFTGPGERAAVSLGVAAGVQGRVVERILARHGVTGAQYNVLRILRGAPDACSRGDLLERLVFPSSDVTRLVDRLEKQGLVSRTEDPQDRRVRLHRITETGLRLLDEIQPDLDSLHRRLEDGLGRERLTRLIELTEQVVRTLAPDPTDGSSSAAKVGSEGSDSAAAVR